MNVLVIAPHPDDEVLGCGGTIARHVADGDCVHVCIVTIAHPGILKSDLDSREESTAALEFLGVSKTHYLDFFAPTLDATPGCELSIEFAKLINEHQIERLYIPHHGDMHTDHGATYTSALVASRPRAGCPVKEVLVYETVSETDWAPPRPDMAFVPNVFIDISPYLKTKLEAMSHYASQVKPPPDSRSLKNIEALATLRGSTVACESAEAFMLIRSIR